MHKEYYAILSTVATERSAVGDFSLVVVDRDGVIRNECAVLVKEQYERFMVLKSDDISDPLQLVNLEARYNAYLDLLQTGNRMLASKKAINGWLGRCIETYNPKLVSYNLHLHAERCSKTGIDLSGFQSKYCLHEAAKTGICSSSEYKDFLQLRRTENREVAHENGAPATEVDAVIEFIKGKGFEVPSTALETIKDVDIPIFKALLAVDGFCGALF